MQTPEAPIAFFLDDILEGYGSEKYTITLANELARQGQKVDLLYQKGSKTLLAQLAPSVRQISLSSERTLEGILALKKYLQATPPAALFGIMEKSSIMVVLASLLAGYRCGVPTVHLNIDSYAQQEHRIRRLVLRLLMGALYRHAPAIVCVSEGASEALKRWVGPQVRRLAILNGFDLESLRERAAEPLDDPLFERTGTPLLVGCGRLVRRKGFDTLIKAFAFLRKKRAAHLVILGEGEDKNELQTLIKKLGLEKDVTLKGYTANPSACFAHADLFVHAARTEGFGNVVVEALAAGTEAVCVDTPSGPREILHDGDYGKIVAVDDIEGLAAAIEATLASPRSEEEKAETQAYLDRTFSLSVMAQSYIRLVASLNAA